MSSIRLTTQIVLLCLVAACSRGESSSASNTPASRTARESEKQPSPPIDRLAADDEDADVSHEESFHTPLEASPPDHGEELGSFDLTYYWMAREARRAPRQTTLFTKRCRPISRVSRRFARRLALEGSGRLRDGRVLTAAGRCGCETSPCYRTARRNQRWGAGVQERPLSPFRSIAVDPTRVSIGQTLYIPELDGMTMPGPRPWGGFVHDGCVIADDRGGGVRGKQIDFFTARKSHYRALFKRHNLTEVTVYDGHDRCADLARGAMVESDASAAHRNSI